MILPKPKFSTEGQLCLGTTPQVGQAHTMGIEYLDGLYSYAMVLTQDRAEAEDLVQETYVRAMQAMRRQRVDSNIKGWLFTILRNICFNQLRKRRNSPQMIEIDVGLPTTS